MSGGRVIFLRNRLALFAVVAKEFKEALVTTSLDAGNLEIVPRILEQRLDVRLELREGLTVNSSALRTDEGAKRNVAMA